MSEDVKDYKDIHKFFSGHTEEQLDIWLKARGVRSRKKLKTKEQKVEAAIEIMKRREKSHDSA